MSYSLDDREGRVIASMMGVLWAYFDALDRGDSVAAHALLSDHQQNWATLRPHVLSAFEDATRNALDATVPRSLAVDGVWGPNTLSTVRVVIFATFGHDVYMAVQGSIPMRATTLASWWRTNLALRFPQTSTNEVAQVIWSFALAVRADQGIHAAQVVDARAAEVIAEVPTAAPLTSAGATQTVSIQSQSSSSGSGTTTPVPGGSSDAFTFTAPVTDPDTSPLATGGGSSAFDDIRITARTQQWSGWMYLVGGLGLATFGLVSWWLWRMTRKSGRRMKAA